MMLKFSAFIFAVSLMSLLLLMLFSPKQPYFHEELQQTALHKVLKKDLNDMCAHLKSDIMAMNASRTQLALARLHEKVRLCLPFMSQAQQDEIIQLSEHMYQRLQWQHSSQPMNLEAININTKFVEKI